MQNNALFWLLACLGLTILFDKFLPIWTIETTRWTWAPIGIVGLWLLAAAMSQVVNNRQLAKDTGWLDPSDLGGPFRISRNPFYLATVLLFSSFVTWLESLGAGLGLLLYILVVDRRLIPLEEAEHLRRNSRKAAAYMERTRRWI